MTRHFDIVIAGGGSAGCVLANRLSADGKKSVAQIEAGPDTPPDHADEVLWDSYPIVAYFDPRHHWTDLRVYHQAAPESGQDTRPLRRYEQARVMGGGSSINGMMANRGAPADFDEWAALGAGGWAWEDVLPWYRKLERDLDCDGPLHGSDGPMPLRRVPRSEWPRFSTAAAEALEASGLPYVFDQHDGFEPAYFPIVINNEYDRRASTATRYLTGDVRSRSNLAIFSDTRVTRLLFEGKRVTGVELAIEGGVTSTFTAGEVVLACGAIHTPALLQRSGIGDGRGLQRLGIKVIADSPAVGRNLQEHPQIAVTSYLVPEARQPWSLRRHIFAGFRYSSGIEGCGEVDMYGVVVNRGAWHALGQKLGGFLIWVNKAYSQGWVGLRSPHPDIEPKVEMNFLGDDRDRLRLEDALKRVAALYRHPAMREVAKYPYPSSYTEASRDRAVVTLKNRLWAAPIARALDGPAPLRRRTMASQVSGGLSLFNVVDDPDRLTEFIRDRAHGTWHCCGTARMGREDDPAAVTDPAGRVYGVEGLRVADASLMPTVPRANTNLPTIMIGEKIAGAMIEEWP
jgi:5-(hydroxymethyl)furfural/furfural oxidase